MMESKRCSSCKVDKPVVEFHVGNWRCKECQREYYQANKEKFNPMVVCACGCLLRRNVLRRHEASKTHRRLMAKKFPPLQDSIACQ